MRKPLAEPTARSVLNELIDSCKDAERGFLYAAHRVSDTAVQALFLEIAAERARFAEELLPQAQRLGGGTWTDGTRIAALHRGWMTIQDALTGDNNETIIREVERGETSALATYEDALEGALPPDARDLVERQHTEIQEALNRLRLLRMVENMANWVR
jgi:uncharacterized protein (TIGR02284 family)